MMTIGSLIQSSLARIPDEFVPQELLCARPQIRVLRQALGNKVLERQVLCRVSQHHDQARGSR
jgi:hypothetical protein